VFSERTSVGLDVHARSVVACGLDTVTGVLHRQRLVPAFESVMAWLATLPAPVAVVYQAGPTGYGLARQLMAAGLRCVVAAPSKLQRPAGDRVKTDLLTELPDRLHGSCVRRPARVARFPVRDQRFGFTGFGGAAGAAAGIGAVDRGSVPAVSAG